MIVATAGHVDHGKTRLVHALTGIQTDRLEEEQARGLTIDLGFAYTNIESVRVGFVDVPGHIRFISNMLAGVAAVDFALIVIAADDGPMPQTVEHLAILNLLGISRGVIALSKVDRVDANRVETAREEIRQLVAGTPFEAFAIVPVSSETGAGVDKLGARLASEARQTQATADEAGFRLAIDRCFTMKGAGVVVTGSAFSGRVTEGQEVFVLPAGLPARVRGIRRQNEPAKAGQAGDRLAINLAGAGITKSTIHRGNWLTQRPITPTERADVSITVLSTETQPLRHWTPVHLHAAASHVTGRIAILEGNRIEPGQRGLAQLVLSQPINLWADDRVVLRDQGATRTIAGGFVIDPVSPRRGRARPERIALLTALLATDPATRLERLLLASASTIDLAAYADAQNMTLAQARDLLTPAGGTLLGSQWGISPGALERLSDAVLAALKRWHEAHTEAAGISAAQLRRAAGKLPEAAIVELMLERLVKVRKLEKNSSGYALPGQRAALGAPEAKLLEKALPILERSGTQPPVLHDLAKALGMPVGAVEKLLANCARMGYLVRPAPNRFFVPQAVQSLKDVATQLAGEAATASFTVKEFRDAAGIGRNLSIEVLEYFDRTGFTVRLGDNRKLQVKVG